jgi:hypothetical protein
LRGDRAIIVGPPLEAIAFARVADILLLGCRLREPVGGHDLPVARLAVGQHEQPEPREIARGGLEATTGDFMPRLAL